MVLGIPYRLYSTCRESAGDRDIYPRDGFLPPGCKLGVWLEQSSPILSLLEAQMLKQILDDEP